MGTLITPQDIPDPTKQLMIQNLFGVFAIPGSTENEYAMKAIMRTLSLLQVGGCQAVCLSICLYLSVHLSLFVCPFVSTCSVICLCLLCSFALLALSGCLHLLCPFVSACLTICLHFCHGHATYKSPCRSVRRSVTLCLFLHFWAF